MDQTNASAREFICLYGPPGAGKTTLGRLLADQLDLPFYDLDGEVESGAGASIPEIFARIGETGFRTLEAARLREILQREPGVVALGGGALLDPSSRGMAEAAGQVLCLNGAPQALLERALAQPSSRPLLGSDGNLEDRLRDLLEKRKSHYASFPLSLDTTNLEPEAVLRQAQIRLGAFRLKAMGNPYDVRIHSGGLDRFGALLAARVDAPGKVAIVSDSHVAPLYAARLATSLESAGFQVAQAVIPAGESHKTIETVGKLWAAFLEAGLERSSLVVSLGGGVVSDLAGFAAATYLRGIRWAALPTSLLAMADASLGGKTGADLPQGKNLIGAFHPPLFVLADPQVLETLPVAELRNGLGEVVKQGILGDPGLFELCAAGWDALQGHWDELVRRAMAVKIGYIEADPYEKGPRAALNLGHTVGHGIELASDFALRHGEAVAIGLVVEARLAEEMGLAEPGLAERIAAVLAGLGLPSAIPQGINQTRILASMRLDKKRLGGAVRFALPLRVGEVRTGVSIDPEQIFKEEQ